MSWQSILVQWDPPASSNGVITHYIITVEGNSTNFSSYDRLHTFRNLLSNITYQFKIKAATSAGDGEEQICNASTLPEKGNKLFKLIILFNLNDDCETSRPEIPALIQAAKSCIVGSKIFVVMFLPGANAMTSLTDNKAVQNLCN